MSDDPMLGKVLRDRFRIEELLGRGGMGRVYKGLDLDLGDEVAIKVLFPHLAGKPSSREESLSEARLPRKLKHDGIIKIYDVSSKDENDLYIVIEFIKGPDLKTKLEELKAKRMWLSLYDSLEIIREICKALDYARQQNVIHRDIKPENIMLKPKLDSYLGYQPVLTDFGLALMGGDQITTQSASSGTPAYMSPEQHKGKKTLISHRSDIYSLGVILYELVVGQRPFANPDADSSRGEYTQAIIHHNKHETLPSPCLRRPDLPKEIEDIILKATMTDPKKRFDDAGQMEQALKQALPIAEMILTGPSSEYETVRLADEKPIGCRCIRNETGNELPLEVLKVLCKLFNCRDYKEAVIKKEFGNGLSGARVFEIRPIEVGGKSQLRTIVKVASISQIQKEQKHFKEIHLRVPNIPWIIDEPVLLEETGLGALRYQLAGDGEYEIETLLNYCKKSPKLIDKSLNELFNNLNHLWNCNLRSTAAYPLQPDYDRLLPVILSIDPVDSSTKPDHVVSPTTLPSDAIRPGSYVQVEGFVVEKVDLLSKNKKMILKLPPTVTDKSCFVRVEINTMGERVKGYKYEEAVGPIIGLVTETRNSRLEVEVKRIFDGRFDFESDTLSLSNGLRLPNPPKVWQKLLNSSRSVREGTCHNDLHLENVLIVKLEQGPTIAVIDFVHAGLAHVLHDFLRLEVDVMIRLVPEILQKHDLPPAETIFNFYERLHYKLDSKNPLSLELPHPDLQKPFDILLTIRDRAKGFLNNSTDWSEYYQGLAIYLIGALRYGSLNQLNGVESLLPKQVAFWGAATTLVLPSYKEKKDDPQPPRPPLPPLDRYTFIKRLSDDSATMAEVHKALDKKLKIDVAIKLIDRRYLYDIKENETFVKRFEQEAVAQAKLRHPNIVQIFDYDSNGERPYIVMEFVDGSTLEARLKAGELYNLPEIAVMFKQLAEVVDYAHQNGIIHRDLKPANIMFTTQGDLKLTDFGLARLTGAQSQTLTGDVIGTPAYISPEQAVGQKGDQRSDIYSLGVILFELVTGRRPFPGDTPAELILSRLTQPAPPPSSIKPVPPTIDEVILKALAKDPAERYEKAGALAQAFEEALELFDEHEPGKRPIVLTDTIGQNAVVIAIVIVVFFIMLPVFSAFNIIPVPWWAGLAGGLVSLIAVLVYDTINKN